MSKQFENDELLMALKKSDKTKAAPILDDQILINASATATRRKAISRKPVKILVSALGGVAAFAIVTGGVVAINAKPGMNGNRNDGPGSASKVWIPDVVATAGQDLAVTSDWNAPSYRSIKVIPAETFVRLLVDYFDLHGEVTKSEAFSSEDFSNVFDVFRLEDKDKNATLAVFDSSVISFSLSFEPQSKSVVGTTKEEAELKFNQILKDLKARFQPTDVLAIEFSDVQVGYVENRMVASANQVVEGHEVEIGASATFGDGGELLEVSGSFGIFSRQSDVATLPEAQAVSRLGAYWDNPFRVRAIDDPNNNWLNENPLPRDIYCENSQNIEFGSKCITTVDQVVRGYGVTTAADGGTLLVPSYSMYHDGYFIGAVSAMPGDHPQK